MYFCDVKNRPAKEIAPGIRIRTFWQEKMLASVVELDPKSIVPHHSHPHEQSGIVTSGELSLTIAEETRLLKAGDCFIIPGGIEHGGVSGPKGATTFETFSPVREEYKY